MCDCHQAGCGCGSLICQSDGMCSMPGIMDSTGVATLSNNLSVWTVLFAADDAFAYGVYGSLVRWPLHGGDGQRQKMAGGHKFSFNHPGVTPAASGMASGQLPVIADADRIYFVAGNDTSELSNSLWSMPKDDSAAPTRHGLAGSVIAQDQDHLYFSNDGDSRVLRLSKTALDDPPEQIYASASDAPLTIALIAVNTSSVFVTELPPHATDSTKYIVETVDKATKAVKELSTSDRFTTDAWNSFANDAYFMMAGGPGTDRLDLATTEVKPLGGTSNQASFADGYVYASSNGGGSTQGIWRFDVAAARATHLLSSSEINVYAALGVTGGVFAVANYGGGTIASLLYLKTP
jgi:hypothetical protein